ncbi:AMP phosphorylase [Pyrofollis japonicus]|uniref:AMP phosphorylase n=1 Tax=Pyrofollis japonicus TaxID=3060460 RepID=UPI00295BB3D7|nr:AMP phosphorylase [Pyrofollis japonicus]BEP18702.1 AMP phosphorylase [Pyrofollis japonicus]
MEESVRRFRVKASEVQAGSIDLVMLNPSDALSLGVLPGERIQIICSDCSCGAALIVSKSVEQGTVVVSEGIQERIKITGCDTVHIVPLGVPGSLEFLKKRLRGEKLGAKEIKAIIADIVQGYYDDAGIAAFLSAQTMRGMDEEELEYLIRAMVETGTVVEFGETVFDEHSIGGVPGNSKVALLAVPIVASTGLLIPKTSSRAITSPAGTADTMEVLARVAFSPDELRDIAKKVRGVLAWGGSLNLAPADDIFVRVERKLGLDPPVQLVASILAKKLAMSVSNLVLDIPVGKGAKVETETEAEKLASMFMQQAGRLGIKIRIALTYGGEPIGFSVGPALEAQEALETLIKGEGSPSLVTKACSLAGLLLEIGGVSGPGKGFEKACEILRSGQAYAKFREILEAQEGDPDIKPEDIELGKYTYTLEATTEGTVTHIDNHIITMAARAAGAPQDKKAGIRLHAKVGYRVSRGDPLLTVHASSKTKLKEALQILAVNAGIVVEGMLIKVLP